MANRGYKLQEFLAHSANVNCLSIGKKKSRLLITGGDDHKVNLWAIGKPTSIMCLSGHNSPIDSVAFDSSELLVVAGASTGVIKLWDLEQAKMIRALTGHRSNTTAVEFHPFGEFFASGSMDTNLKIWDIRKKGCIHTYKGHTGGISTIRFTPDGRWVVSGGFDNAVKVWDLTAGKLLHDFKFHEGHIRSIDFHPLEFLLATGSADRTVKFWDLETFELIGSSRPESSGVRSIAFHPDGRTLFCGLDDSLKVYSWEPVVCHDAVDMGWSTLGDMCINEGKLLGCSYFQSSLGVWVADISLIDPYVVGSTLDKKECIEQRSSHPEDYVSERLACSTRRSASPDYEVKGIKNIYIDSSDGRSATSPRHGCLNSSKSLGSLDFDEGSNVVMKKPTSEAVTNTKTAVQAVSKFPPVPSIVTRENKSGKVSTNSRKELITFSRTKPGMLLRPTHVRRMSNTKLDESKQTVNFESGLKREKKVGLDELMSNANLDEGKHIISGEPGIKRDKGGLDELKNSDLHTVSATEQTTRKSSDDDGPVIKGVMDKFEKVFSSKTPSEEANFHLKTSHIRRSPDAKCYGRMQYSSAESRDLSDKKGRMEGAKDQTSKDRCTTEDRNRKPINKDTDVKSAAGNFVAAQLPPIPSDNINCVEPCDSQKEPNSIKIVRGVQVVSGRTRSLVESFERREKPRGNEDNAVSIGMNQSPKAALEKPDIALVQPNRFCGNERADTVVQNQCASKTTYQALAASNRPTMAQNQHTSKAIDQAQTRSNQTATMAQSQHANRKMDRAQTASNWQTNIDITQDAPQVSGRDLASIDEVEIIENLIRTHDSVLSTLRSRLTKLQVVRRFWERNDVKGAIDALKKLPDHSVQADVIDALMDKTDVLTLDVFAILLPVLSGLLDSKTERPAVVSLEALLKLVAVFGSLIRSTVSAPRVVGVDLHAEQRLECCKQCFAELQKLQKILPIVVSRRGGLLGKKAQELNLVLQEP